MAEVPIALCQQRILGPKFKTEKSGSIDQSGRSELFDHHQRKCQEGLDFKREPCPSMHLMVETFTSGEILFGVITSNWPDFLLCQPI